MSRGLDACEPFDPSQHGATRRSGRDVGGEIPHRHTYGAPRRDSLFRSRTQKRIDGKVFDNYAPSTGNARNIATEMAKKVEREQTDRIVLNLADSPVDLGAMRAQLHDWPVGGLKEVIAIDKLGNMLHLYP